MTDLTFRLENQSDYRTVEELTREAFWNHYSPGCDEHYLAHILRESDALIKELDLVAVTEGEIAANIMYTNANIICDDGSIQPVLTFGPLSVLPKYQGKGVGSALVEYSKREAARLGYKAILIYGDPDFYSRVGFSAAREFGIATSDNIYAVSLQACELEVGYLSDCRGRFTEDSVFDFNPEAAVEFDLEFPKRERMGGFPSQKRFELLVNMREPRE